MALSQFERPRSEADVSSASRGWSNVGQAQKTLPLGRASFSYVGLVDVLCIAVVILGQSFGRLAMLKVRFS